MRISITKGERDDRLHIVRDDGSEVSTRFPHKGPLPHDYVHLAVEQRVGLGDAFWGKVAAGADPEQLAELAKMGGHASAARGRLPDPDIVEMVQAERLVECFEADLWSDGGDAASIRSMAEAGWLTSHVPPLALPDEVIDRVRADLRSFASRWRELPIGAAITLEWHG